MSCNPSTEPMKSSPGDGSKKSEFSTWFQYAQNLEGSGPRNPATDIGSSNTNRSSFSDTNSEREKEATTVHSQQRILAAKLPLNITVKNVDRSVHVADVHFHSSLYGKIFAGEKITQVNGISVNSVKSFSRKMKKNKKKEKKLTIQSPLQGSSSDENEYKNTSCVHVPIPEQPKRETPRSEIVSVEESKRIGSGEGDIVEDRRADTSASCQHEGHPQTDPEKNRISHSADGNYASMAELPSKRKRDMLKKKPEEGSDSASGSSCRTELNRSTHSRALSEDQSDSKPEEEVSNILSEKILDGQRQITVRPPIRIRIRSSALYNGSVCVTLVKDESPLKGKLFVGDIISHINGEAVFDVESAASLIRKNGNCTLTLTVREDINLQWPLDSGLKTNTSLPGGVVGTTDDRTLTVSESIRCSHAEEAPIYPDNLSENQLYASQTLPSDLSVEKRTEEIERRAMKTASRNVKVSLPVGVFIQPPQEYGFPVRGITDDSQVKGEISIGQVITHINGVRINQDMKTSDFARLAGSKGTECTLTVQDESICREAMVESNCAENDAIRKSSILSTKVDIHSSRASKNIGIDDGISGIQETHISTCGNANHKKPCKTVEVNTEGTEKGFTFPKKNKSTASTFSKSLPQVNTGNEEPIGGLGIISGPYKDQYDTETTTIHQLYSSGDQISSKVASKESILSDYLNDDDSFHQERTSLTFNTATQDETTTTSQRNKISLAEFEAGIRQTELKQHEINPNVPVSTSYNGRYPDVQQLGNSIDVGQENCVDQRSSYFIPLDTSSQMSSSAQDDEQSLDQSWIPSSSSSIRTESRGGSPAFDQSRYTSSELDAAVKRSELICRLAEEREKARVDEIAARIFQSDSEEDGEGRGVGDKGSKTCPNCLEVFSSELFLNHHILTKMCRTTVADRNHSDYYCDACFEVFSTQRILEYHQARFCVPTRQDQDYENCSSCGLTDDGCICTSQGPNKRQKAL